MRPKILIMVFIIVLVGTIVLLTASLKKPVNKNKSLGVTNKLLNSLNKNSAAIQAIMVFVLVLITIWYAISTKKMANIMSKDLELAYTPICALDNKELKIVVQEDLAKPNGLADKASWLTLRFYIINLGKVPVKFITKVVFNGKRDKIASDSPVVLYPGQSIRHTTKKFEINEVAPKDIKGEVTTKIIYWALGTPEKKRFHERRYELVSKPDRGWIVLEDNAGEEK